MRLGSPLSASVAIHGAALALIAATPYVAPVALRPLAVDFLHASVPPAMPGSAVVARPSPARVRQPPATPMLSSAAASDFSVPAVRTVASPPTPGTGPGEPPGVVELPPRYDAAYLDNPPPAYPPAARRRHIEGTVLLDVAVGADGRPTAVDVAASSGEDQLDRAALAAVRTWRFVPARRGGEAVAGQVQVPMRFRLEG